MARNYKKEAQYEDSPTQVQHREIRNAARAKMEKLGKVSKGDKKDVGHLLALGRGGTKLSGGANGLSNLAVQSITENRSFARKKNGKMLSETSKKERK